jgi:hypothetical protein
MEYGYSPVSLQASTRPDAAPLEPQVIPPGLVEHLLHLPLGDRHRLVCQAMAAELDTAVSLLRDDPETCAALRAHAEVWRGRQAESQDAPGQAGQLLQFRRPA